MLNCPAGVHRIVLSLVIAVCGKSLAKRCDASRFCFKEAIHQRRPRHQLENSCGNHPASLTVRQWDLSACPPTKYFFFSQPQGHFCRFVHETNLVNVILRQEPLDAFQHQDIVRVYLQRPRLSFYHCLRPAWILFVISWQWRSKDLTDNASPAASPPRNRSGHVTCLH